MTCRNHSLAMLRPSFIETLETRLAPAIINPLADLIAGPAQTGASVELGQLIDPFTQMPGHTLVKFTLSLDLDPNTAGIQLDTDPNTPGDQLPTVIFELFDDDTPLTVANFLRYAVNSTNGTQFENDYTGTFLHRMTSFGGTTPEIDIVQGGGFATTAISTHIPTFATLHNEFSAAHPNVRGTLAMAKTGISPHTGSSEWFVNTTDNTSILGGNNNGGFTVFGEVIAGMEYFDRIAALQKLNASASGSALGELPVQNFSATAGLKTENLIAITGVEVIKPQPGNTTGQTFRVLTITDPATGLASDVVTAPTGDLATSLLPLTYVAGKNGVADVTVRVTLNGEASEDTFRVTVRPNLIASLTGETLPAIVVPGDVVKPTITLFNTGGAAFNGTVDVNFYLSPPTGTDTDGRLRDADDILIGSFSDTPVTVASDGTVTLSQSFNLGARLDKPDGAYRLIAEVIPASGAPTELFTDDNVAPDGNGHSYANQFGLITIAGFGSRVAKLNYTEADGNVVTLSITGAGVGKASANDGGVNLTISGTNPASVVNLGTALSATDKTPTRAEFHHIDVVSPLGTLNFAQADVDGYITMSSGVKVAKFGDVTGQNRTFVLGGFGALNTTPAKLSFGRVSDLSIESDQRIKSLTAIEWLNTADSARDRITAPTLTKLNITGSAEAGIRGDLEADVEVLLATKISSFTVKGFLNDSTVTTPGNVGSVKLGGMFDSNFFAGTTARPDSLEDFTAKRTINKFTITGVANAGTLFFADSQVAASTIAKIVVKGIDGTSGDSAFGFVADKVNSYASSGSKTKLSLTQPAVIGASGNYSLTIL